MLRRGDHDFRLAVNRVLARIYRSGEIEKIYGRWLGPLGPPSVLLSATYFIQTTSRNRCALRAAAPALRRPRLRGAECVGADLPGVRRDPRDP